MGFSEEKQLTAGISYGMLNLLGQLKSGPCLRSGPMQNRTCIWLPITSCCATCKGSYEQGEIMNAVLTWIIDNGYQLDGPAFDLYHIIPYKTTDPNDFVVEVCYPVWKK